jgi:hypothetical protein
VVNRSFINFIEGRNERAYWSKYVEKTDPEAPIWFLIKSDGF